ncbi:MAG: SAM-dependent methyltransferase [Burkholderiales bacterium]|nr:SAM-dependent methyltransferase [Burkholderiales bacterium]
MKSNSPQEKHDIRPGQSIELLKELHILTRDGKLNQDSRRKLKQVYHLYQFIEPLLNTVLQERGQLSLVDHGAGKSYLGFILFDLFFKALGADHPSRIYGIETRDELVTRSREMKKKAKFMVLVPCCQAEVAAELRKTKGDAVRGNALSELWRHPIHTREFGSQITNVLRCLQLESHGYQVRVTELVGWEHSMKNELIIAEYKGGKNNKSAQRLHEILNSTGLQSLERRFFTA